jgi:hypothetical protein
MPLLRLARTDSLLHLLRVSLCLELLLSMACLRLLDSSKSIEGLDFSIERKKTSPLINPAPRQVFFSPIVGMLGAAD